MKTITHANKLPDLLQRVKKQFHEFIIENEHPCIMANTVFSMKDYELNLYESLGTKSTAKELMSDIEEYLRTYNFDDNNFKTLIAVFPNPEVVSEIEFENLLWRQLQFIHDQDTHPWDPRVSDDPEDDTFSFSIGGRAFYVIGMHPESSRMARRAPYPTLVFNLHWQFEKLREMGAYHKVRDKIRERDAALQGNINPVLEDFGESSEARQYSGRNVEKSWK